MPQKTGKVFKSKTAKRQAVPATLLATELAPSVTNYSEYDEEDYAAQTGKQQALHYDEEYRRYKKGNTAAEVPYDRDIARALREDMVITTIKGDRMDLSRMKPEDVAGNIELLAPMVRPYGCGPVAPADWLVLRTYQKIVEVRDEIRFDEFGLCIGDRTFKRCYQQAMRDIARFNNAPEALQARAREAGPAGVPDTSNPANPHARLRAEAEAVQHAFKFLGDKNWHRWLFPFGCFFYEKRGTDGDGWSHWREGMANPTGAFRTDVCINPYSVTAADVLYLCNTVGYLERFTFIIGVILWAKQRGCNLLHHRKRGSSQFRRFMTLEKHLHVFGSIHMHRRVLQMNSQDIGGHWDEMLELLNDIESEMCSEFGVVKNSLARDFNNMIIERNRNSPAALVRVFPSCKTVGSARTLSAR